MHPKARVNTTVKGWMKDPNNIRYDERIEITRGLKNNSVNAKIILDLHNKKVVKNIFNRINDSTRFRVPYKLC
jgi:hypothetical protein